MHAELFEAAKRVLSGHSPDPTASGRKEPPIGIRETMGALKGVEEMQAEAIKAGDIESAKALQADIDRYNAIIRSQEPERAHDRSQAQDDEVRSSSIPRR